MWTVLNKQQLEEVKACPEKEKAAAKSLWSPLMPAVPCSKLVWLLKKGAFVKKVVIEISMPNGQDATLDCFGRFSLEPSEYKFDRVKCPECGREVSVSSCGIWPHYGNDFGPAGRLHCSASGKHL